MEDATWWQRGVIYHIYPRSFMDSDAATGLVTCRASSTGRIT
jgi:hypothetical protein